MHIKFVLSATLPYDQPSYPFPINMIDLENAVSDVYLGIGTPYKPIAIDNFVEIGKNVFPNIDRATTISVSLEPDNDNESDKTLQLVCCIVRNVGKSFVDGSNDLSTYWSNIFKLDPNLMYGAPNGTLFVSPDPLKNPKECSIQTLGGKFSEYISYTIMFSMPLTDKKSGTERLYYFILDPLVKISSGVGTGHL